MYQTIGILFSLSSKTAREVTSDVLQEARKRAAYDAADAADAARAKIRADARRPIVLATIAAFERAIEAR